MINVLVVDDEEDVQFLFKQYFRREIRKAQISFTFALSGEAALEHLRHTDTDVVLVLSDINMPGMTGLELLKIIKSQFPALRVVMITAYGDAQNRQTAFSYGADGYVTKPIDFPELKDTISAFS